MATIANITNPVWGLSIKGYGVIVQGIASIKQCIDLIIRTSQGTDPLRPLFGSLVYSYTDSPLNIAIPNIKREIFDALDLWETRIKVIAIKHIVQDFGIVQFEIVFRLIDEDIIDSLLFDLEEGILNNSTGLNEIVVTANFPENPNSYRYYVSFEKNGSNVFPSAPPAGFITQTDLFNWVQSNWFYLGRFFYLPNKIICYMKSDDVTSASMAISVMPIIQFGSDLPILNPGESYTVEFKKNGNDVIPLAPAGFTNPGQLLAFAQTNWVDYNWYIEYVQSTGESVFSDEFSDEFTVTATGYKIIGIAKTEGVYTLNVTI